MRAPTLARVLRSPLALILAVALFVAPRAAHAQPYAWNIPAGGETWTAGTTHTVFWSAGPTGVNANVYLISLSPFQNLGAIALNVPFPQFTTWAIPSNLPPGAYQIYVEDVATTTFLYSNTFNVQAGPACAQSCTHIAIVPDNFGGYPGTHCGTTEAIAMANAQSWLGAQLANACAQGWNIDNSSIIADYTVVPTGACYVNEFGAFQVEVSAVACCCPGPTSTKKSTWGTVKQRYR